MRILIAHNRYQFAAGEEAVVTAEYELLRSHSHTVQLFEVDNHSIDGAWSKVKAAVSAIYSTESKVRVGAAIAQFEPDVVHVHNFFPLLSPSVYDACHEANVPVVQTLHNYRIICPNGKLYRDGKRCEECVGQVFPVSGVIHRCYRESVAQSATVATMIAVHQQRQTWQERVDAFITLTQFQKQKMIQAGLPEDRIYVKPNFIFDANKDSASPEKRPARCSSTNNFALFVGRFWEEKGISTLIQAYVDHGIPLPLKIIGDGPLRPQLEAQVEAAGLSSRVEFLGWQEKSVVLRFMRQAQFLMFPSVWYETFGLSVIEAFASGTPVIASRLGCMAELIEEKENGLLFEPGNAQDLAAKVEWAIAHPNIMQSMGYQARQTYEALYTPEQNYRQLMKIYRAVAQASAPPQEVSLL